MNEKQVNLNEEPLLLPVRMLNEFTYCPRLAYLEWIQGEFVDNVDTVDGQYKHKRVNQEPARRENAKPDEENDVIHERSVYLTADRIGLTAKMDLLEGTGRKVSPVDYKRGKRPHIQKGAWEPELVQLCAQGLILKENGFECDAGIIYFVGSKERVGVEFDEELVSLTLSQAEKMRELADLAEIPPPLADSAKCVRCSLVGICLPDEVYLLRKGKRTPVRKLAPARDHALPLYVQQPKARVGKCGDILLIKDGKDVIAEARLVEVSQLVLFGSVQVSTQVIHELCRRNIPICYLSGGGWFYGVTHGITHKNVEIRKRQFEAALDKEKCLSLAKYFVRAKIANCRTVLRRNHIKPPKDVLRDLKSDMDQAMRCDSLESLLGTEGVAAQKYFCEFSGLLKSGSSKRPEFDFRTRNRRPPRDPVNALLSFAYAILTREWAVVLQNVGLDPYMGFYHQTRYGKPALALDLMEEFRPLIADSVVITAINNGEVRNKDFIVRFGSAALTPEGRKRFLQTYERRMGQEIAHPVFGYRVSYRRILEIQARLLGRYLLGEIPMYPSFTTR
ncbi:MAG: CRISPR-associated endonuclease Cas1 [Actinobacteria bacterium]|nr:CRISPR-associated endonuclease Cas1 [Actinomycetota bacterium]